MIIQRSLSMNMTKVYWSPILFIYCRACFGKQDIHWIGFVSDFGFYRRQISKRSTGGYRTFRDLEEHSFVLLK